MVTAITNGIKISVETHYRMQDKFQKGLPHLFSYVISIENKSSRPCTLLRRHWLIFDSLSNHDEVEGAGVVGEQPTIAPGDTFRYESFCRLVSEFGTMKGSYLMCWEPEGLKFSVNIPEFNLISPYRLN